MRGWVRRARGGVASFIIGGSMLPAGSAAAQGLERGSLSDAETPSPARAATGVVDVTIVAGGEDTEPLMDTIRQLVGRLGLAVNAHTSVQADGLTAQLDAGAPADGLSVWIDLVSRYEVVIFVRDRRGAQRRTISRDASPAIVREEVGEAVRSAVESSLLVDEPMRVPPPAATMVAPPARAVVAETVNVAAPSSHPFALDVTTLAGAGLVATGVGPVAHVGGGVIFGSRRRWRPSLSVVADYDVPFDDTVPSVPVAARAWMVSLRTIPAIEVLHRSWIAVDVGAGGGVDLIIVSAESQPSVTPAEVPTLVDPILTARATTYLAMTPGVMFTIAAGGDFDLAARHYVIDGTNGGDVFVPWRVRPAVLAGFTFTAVGNALFAARTP